MGNREMKIPYHECPSFINCSAPKCPLDPEIDERSNRWPEEQKCMANKPTRMKIGEKFSDVLKYKGLTSNEWLGYKNAGYTYPQIVSKILSKGGKRLKTLKSTL